MNQKPMLTSSILLVFSWIIGSIGVILAGVYIFSHHLGFWLIFKGILIVIACALLAAVVRMLGNIGQMLFELKDSIYTLRDIKETASHQRALAESIDLKLQSLNEVTLSELREILLDHKYTSDSIDNRLNVLNAANERLGKDLMALSQTVDALKLFFDQIGKHLELNK